MSARAQVAAAVLICAATYLLLVVAALYSLRTLP